MELDRSYFNSIRLNTHRGKFYDVEAVDRLLVDIRSRADALNKEVYASREKLAEAEKTAEALREENNELFRGRGLHARGRFLVRCGLHGIVRGRE